MSAGAGAADTGRTRGWRAGGIDEGGGVGGSHTDTRARMGTREWTPSTAHTMQVMRHTNLNPTNHDAPARACRRATKRQRTGASGSGERHMHVWAGGWAGGCV